MVLKFYHENLVVLKMRNNNLEQLWTGIKVYLIPYNNFLLQILIIRFSNICLSFLLLLQNLDNLKYVDLSCSKHLFKIPNLSNASKLESSILEDCTSLLRSLFTSIQNLNKLVNLNLRNCKSLISLSIGIQLKSRDVIKSQGCSKYLI